MMPKPLTPKEVREHVKACYAHCKTCPVCNLFLLKTLEAINNHRLQEAGK